MGFGAGAPERSWAFVLLSAGADRGLVPRAVGEAGSLFALNLKSQTGRKKVIMIIVINRLHFDVVVFVSFTLQSGYAVLLR